MLGTMLVRCLHRRADKKNTSTPESEDATPMSNPVPMFGTQNVNDDDGQVIDSFFIETDTPPPLKDAQEPIVLPEPPEIVLPTRMFAGTDVLTAASTPYMLMPADTNRVNLHLDIYSFATTPSAKDYVFIADENGKISSVMSGASSGAFKGRHNKGIDLDNHTGAVWIGPGPILGDNIEISWRTVTK